MADASVLGIHPPSTVVIDLEGWVQAWPWDSVAVYGDEVVISVPLTNGRRRVVFYPYEHAEQDPPSTEALYLGYRDYKTFLTIPRSWTFHGRETFRIHAGPPQPVSLN